MSEFPYTFPYISVTLSEQMPGEAAGKFHYIYNYPPEQEPDADAAFDGTAAIHEFLNLRECYALWSSPRGHYFSLITPNPASSRGTSLVLTVRLDNECALAGRRTVGLLAELKKALVEARNLTTEAVERAFEAAGLTPEPERLKSWQYEPPLTSASAPKRPLCYRTYASSSELDAVMSFPNQVEYACYDRVMAVQATASLRPGSHLDRITAQLKREYTVIAPVGCTPSRKVVTDGERLTLTYTKAGFNPHQENVSVGAPSPYVRYDGPAIRVKTAAESGMGFVRRVPLVVRSSKGIPVNGFTINVNGKPVNTMEPYIEVTERDLTPEARTEIQVASNNYKPLKVVKTPSELINSDKVELVLEPIEQGIMLRLDFGDGRIFKQEITLEKNTREYSQLHSGNFHGFRAHRLTVAGNDEVYNVDMKSPARTVQPGTSAGTPTQPVAPNIPRSGEAAEHEAETDAPRRPVAPVFGKDTPDDRRARREARERERERRNRPAASDAAPAEGTPAEGADDIIEERRGSRGLWIAIIVTGLVVAGALAYFLLPDPKVTPYAAVEGTDSIAAVTDSASVAAAPQALTADEKADVEYLNDNTKTWRVSELKSPRYRALIAAMAEGDIDAVVQHDYFANGRATNATAVSIADMIWGAKGSPNEAGNARAMRKSVKDSVVQVWDMYEAVAKVRPTEPNPAPRPVKK